MSTFPAPRRRAADVDLTEVWVRGALSVTRDGLRALEHDAASRLAATAGLRRHHRRAAQRLAKRAGLTGSGRSETMAESDAQARERVGELTELIDHVVVGVAAVDWRRVGEWAREIARIADGLALPGNGERS